MKLPLCSTIICFANTVIFLIGCRFWFITDLLEPCYFIPLNVTAATNPKQSLKMPIATTHTRTYPVGIFFLFLQEGHRYTFIMSHKNKSSLELFSLLGLCALKMKRHSHTEGVHARSHLKIAVKTGKCREHLESPCCESTLLLSAAVIICSALQLHDSTDLAWRLRLVCLHLTHKHTRTYLQMNACKNEAMRFIYHPQFKREVVSLALSQGSKQETGSKASMIPSKRIKCKRRKRNHFIFAISFLNVIHCSLERLALCIFVCVHLWAFSLCQFRLYKLCWAHIYTQVASLPQTNLKIPSPKPNTV